MVWIGGCAVPCSGWWFVLFWICWLVVGLALLCSWLVLLRMVFGGLVLVGWFDLLRVCYAAWDWRLLLGFL